MFCCQQRESDGQHHRELDTQQSYNALLQGQSGPKRGRKHWEGLFRWTAILFLWYEKLFLGLIWAEYRRGEDVASLDWHNLNSIFNLSYQALARMFARTIILLVEWKCSVYAWQGLYVSDRSTGQLHGCY
jgi:hypothetical protein